MEIMVAIMILMFVIFALVIIAIDQMTSYMWKKIKWIIGGIRYGK